VTFFRIAQPDVHRPVETDKAIGHMGVVMPRHVLARTEGELSNAQARSFSQSDSLVGVVLAFSRLHVRHSSFSESLIWPFTRSWIVSSTDRRSLERKWRVDELPVTFSVMLPVSVPSSVPSGARIVAS